MIQGVDPEEVRAALRAVLERERIPTPAQEPGPIERWLGEVLNGLFGGVDGASLFEVIKVGTIVTLVLLLVGVLILAWRRRGRAADLPDAVRRKARARRLYQEARAAEARGEVVLALRLALFALVVALGEGGVLDFHPGWTDRELLDRGAPRAAVRDRLTGLLDELEPKLFGRVPAEDEDLRRLERLTRELAPEALG